MSYKTRSEASKRGWKKRRAEGVTVTCLDCGHRGWRLTIRSRCPSCGVKARYSNVV